MDKKIVTGLYFHYPGSSDKITAIINELISFAKVIPEVSAIWTSHNQPINESEKFIQEILEKEIQQIIVVGTKAGFIQPFFNTVMRTASRNQNKVKIFDFDEKNIFQSSDTPLAKAILFSQIMNLRFDGLHHKQFPLNHKETLVIGGGIAGIQAALEIANSGNKVFLVEKTGSIGGHMAMFDKTFPTLDCAACILTPKMVDVGQHPNIEVLTLSELTEISGKAGDFTVTISKKARRVSETLCIGCGSCAEKCPSRTSSEFDAGTTMRKSIYIPFPQAVPNKYLIDADSCIYVEKGKCGACVKACPVENCIQLDEPDKELKLKVGNIIVATGFKTFDASRIEQFGYGKYPNVLTSLEFERLVNASGPTEGQIRYRTKDKRGNWIFTTEGEEPRKIALIHCVGSRDENFNKYCSRVCCMYSLKLAHLIKEKMPRAKVYEYYIDMRAFGKGYEEFYDRIRHEGIHMVRGRTAMVFESKGHLHLRTEDIVQQKLIEQEVDMVVLAVGLEARPETSRLAQILGLNTTHDGWLKESDSLDENVLSNIDGILIAGACQGPKDIPDAVTQGAAAASKVLENILNNAVNHSLVPETEEDILSKA
ncbi:MAG TPA: disulfide reductase [Bacteroidales bacterium]|jgi:heterodisulfide reductase subunit A|nr:disulfide reductase [Bacteroidales bacterium]